jgi:hypothetical protein
VQNVALNDEDYDHFTSEYLFLSADNAVVILQFPHILEITGKT